ncbi:hypothetical protein GOP47_0001485 [Adiantum capillus-veneris]|uniref:Uncharacterized protein n=1 Tax=Adiantum capillus-veneris TaxID=13818 RepID=A0A9D4ZQ54_ADICA|nr:hypothetical protein GOP47_0001485 [Adiantum capillus-veneris]
MSSLHKLGSSSLLPLHAERHYMLSSDPTSLSPQRCFSCGYPHCKLNLYSRSSSRMHYFSSMTTSVGECHLGQKKATLWKAFMSHGTRFVHSSKESPSRRFNEEWSGLVVRPENRLKQPSLTVAVDIDEVLGSFLLALNTFIAEQYLCEHNISEFHVYDFTKVWQCTRAEADLRVHSFFKSKHFDKGILPIPGAHKALLQIASFCNLCVVTSRQNIIKEETLAWIERHYSGIFSEVHFGNHFALEGEARTKSDICRGVGAHILIDDNPVYALDCAKSGMEVLLFDFNNSYPWSKNQEPQHPSITRVHDWDEVERILRLKSSSSQT